MKLEKHIGTLFFFAVIIMVIVINLKITLNACKDSVYEVSGLRGKTGTVEVDNYQENIKRGKTPELYFDFVLYLESVGADNIECNIGCAQDGDTDSRHTLTFKFDGYDYKFETIEPKIDNRTNYQLSTSIELKNDEKTIYVDTNDSGRYVCDRNTAFAMDETIYQVFRCVLDKNYQVSQFYTRDYIGTGCPLDGTGIKHYEIRNGEIVIHEDAGPDYYRTKCY